MPIDLGSAHEDRFCSIATRQSQEVGALIVGSDCDDPEAAAITDVTDEGVAESQLALLSELGPSVGPAWPAQTNGSRKAPATRRRRLQKTWAKFSTELSHAFLQSSICQRLFNPTNGGSLRVTVRCLLQKNMGHNLARRPFCKTALAIPPSQMAYVFLQETPCQCHEPLAKKHGPWRAATTLLQKNMAPVRVPGLA